MSLLGELRRRNVPRVGAEYIVTAWLIIQVAETMLPVYGFPDATIRYVISALAVGLVPALVPAWIFQCIPMFCAGISASIDPSRSARTPA
jgi:hypothetical protein